ncbi:hypothetical protein [Phytohabitans houttuyneae]|uniref:hypothetical protein n=1 Tax=Phytohabitans houttuyneae TaxID=1076126 RepID=UPI00156610A2|nr:hypothetical protein [Phytohabitans houttuyneae]
MHAMVVLWTPMVALWTQCSRCGCAFVVLWTPMVALWMRWRCCARHDRAARAVVTRRAMITLRAPRIPKHAVIMLRTPRLRGGRRDRVVDAVIERWKA